MLRLLVIEGNNKLARERRANWGGTTPSEGYGNLLSSLTEATYDIATPADSGFNMPSVSDLSGYDGIAMTGSSMHIYETSDEITRQIELAKLALTSGTPIFGSCWGLQVLTVASGGQVHKNKKGREVPVARKIQIRQEGLNHPIFAGKPTLFDAPAIHLDEVIVPSDNVTLLASNDISEVQAFEMKAGNTVAWGVQYHPEYNLNTLAGIMDGIKTLMLNEGFFKDEAEHKAYCNDFRAMHLDPNNHALAWKYGFDKTLLSQNLREKELDNWLTHLVKPTKSKRGRG